MLPEDEIGVQLKGAGIEKDQVQKVILTHLHIDKVSADKDLGYPYRAALYAKSANRFLPGHDAEAKKKTTEPGFLLSIREIFRVTVKV